MKITVTNTALLNTGDAAIMAGTAEILRHAFGAEIEIAVRDQQAAVARDLYPAYDCAPLFHDRVVAWMGARHARLGAAVLAGVAALWRTPLRAPALRLLPRPLRDDLVALARSDLVVSAGGTYLVPHYRHGPKLLELLIARLLGRPYVLFTQSLGPFARDSRLTRRLLGAARLILVRDPRSAGNLRALGIDGTRVHECADAAFALPPVAVPPPAADNRTRIAISVRDWPHFDGDPQAGMARYLDAVAGLVCQLVDRHGARVVFLSTCQGLRSYWTDDSRTAEEVLARVPEAVASQVTIDRRFRTPEELAGRLGTFDLVVATRMHGAILALGAGVPVVAIAYEFKTAELFRRLGLGDLVHDVETISAARLCRTVETALAGREQLRTRLAAEVAELRRSAASAAPHLRRALAGAAA